MLTLAIYDQNSIIIPKRIRLKGGIPMRIAKRLIRAFSSGMVGLLAGIVAAVALYDEAWRNADCDAYFAATTESFRAEVELTDCESFYNQSLTFMSSIEDFTMTVRDVETIGSSVAVSTTETFSSYYDADGNETSEPEQYEDRYEYTVVESGGVWAIDDWFTD